VIGATVLVVATLLLSVLIIGGSRYEKGERKWWRNCFTAVSVLEFSGLLLVLLGIPLWSAYEVESNSSNISCALQVINGWLIFLSVFGIIILAIVVLFSIVEFVRLYRECHGKRSSHERKRLRKWWHVLYRLFITIACVLFWIGAVLWIIVGAKVAIPPSETRPIETWQRYLAFGGGILLGIVFIITVSAYIGRQLYIYMRELASIYLLYSVQNKTG